MKTNHKTSEARLLDLCFFLLPLLICGNSFAQVEKVTAVGKLPVTKSSQRITTQSFSGNSSDLFGTQSKFIENIGQYGDSLPGLGRMGKILYGYEGLNMPVLFTQNGLIHLQRKVKELSYAEKEKLGKKGDVEKDAAVTDRIITMEWLNANSNPEIITEYPCSDYFLYGLLKNKAKTFKKIIYKELYPGIDLEYTLSPATKAGFEYSLVVRPGADINMVKMRYGADVKSIRLDKNGNMIVSSGIDEISISAAVCYYAEDASRKFNSLFNRAGNVIGFKLPENYNKEKTFVIDPFVSGTGNLSGSDAGKAKDIDFDYAGNIYIAGGGSGAAQKLSKYDASGALQWTFNGTLNIPSWEFGGSRGGWVVEKTSGKIYLGQGLAGSGFRVVRLTTGGVFDDYITEADREFAENWKMMWNCNNGNPKIFIAGGGSISNIELAYLSPPSTSLHSSNITGINTGHNDISDILTDPLSNDMYTIFSTSVLNPSGDNKIYKHKAPYTLVDIAWTISPGHFALREPTNRPYLGGLDNSSNTLSINSAYLFYWDGKNLNAFKKADGSVAATTLSITTNTILMQGGIIADECNNVYVGSSNGTIKVFHFNGSVFDDDAVPDITIEGYQNSAVYDLVYDHGKNLLYACGNGFVASVDLSPYCTSTVYTVTVIENCVLSSATASVVPGAPAGSVVTFSLYDGTTLVATNFTGIFGNLTPGKNYTITAMVNQACGGAQATKNFTTSLLPLLKITNPPAICSEGTTDITSASITAGSTPGLLFSYWIDAATTIICPVPGKVGPGTYFIKATTSGGCSVINAVEVNALPAPVANAGTDTVVCSGNNIQLKGKGGVDYLWSPEIYLDNSKIPDPTITNPGNSSTIIYHLKVKDANGCESKTADDVKITFTTSANIFIGNDTIVAMNKPFQLNAIDLTNIGFNSFTWSPTYGLNNPFIKNPVAILDREITYTLQATAANHCAGTAEINIKVFRGAEIFVPNSFTPNGDGLNDLLKPIPIGLKEFHYLKIFNRFGQLLFTTTDPAKGWDGKINGAEIGYGTFIWIGEGLDYKGNLIMRKGATNIIR